MGFRSTTIDYVRHARSRGETKFSGWRLWNFAIDGVTSFSTAPLKVWTYIGGAGAALSLCYAAFIVLRTLILGGACRASPRCWWPSCSWAAGS